MFTSIEVATETVIQPKYEARISEKPLCGFVKSCEEEHNKLNF